MVAAAAAAVTNRRFCVTFSRCRGRGLYYVTSGDSMMSLDLDVIQEDDFIQEDDVIQESDAIQEDDVIRVELKRMTSPGNVNLMVQKNLVYSSITYCVPEGSK